MDVPLFLMLAGFIRIIMYTKQVFFEDILMLGIDT